MKFELLPVIDIMLELYEKPRSIERFREYLEILQGGTKGDLVMPLSGFNPMAKEHLLKRLAQLKDLQAEKAAAEVAGELNKKLADQKDDTTIKIALNIADDLAGGWTNTYTADYDSKFRINALVKRLFCTPFLWTGETWSVALIKERTAAYAWRTIYRLNNPGPKSLEQHVEQERFVAQNSNINKPKPHNDLDALDEFYKKHKSSVDFHVIFNFFYGDKASASLQYPVFENNGVFTGFDYAAAGSYR